MIVCLFLFITLLSPETTGRLLGSSASLMPLVPDYMPGIFFASLFQIWCGIGLFVVRLDGSPKVAMWCNVLPGVLNVILDYVCIFPLGMGIRGAAIATCISCAVGGFMEFRYLARSRCFRSVDLPLYYLLLLE